MGYPLRLLVSLLLLLLAACATNPQASHLTPEQRHRTAVHDMLLASPIPDLLIGGIEKGFKKHATTPRKKALFECASAKLSRGDIAETYTDTAVPLFSEAEAVKLTRYMKSRAGKRGAAHFLAEKLGRPNPYPSLNDEEKKAYGLETLALWLKTPIIMKDERAKADMKVLLVQKLASCKQ
jgi:hypothetical protein